MLQSYEEKDIKTFFEAKSERMRRTNKSFVFGKESN
jgi:hypothetical protein